MSNLIFIISGILALTGLLFVVIRKRNAISLEIDDDEDEEDEIDNEMIVTKPKPISYEQDVLEVEEEVIERELSSKDDLPTNRKTFSLDDEDEVVTTPKRRRVRNSNQNKQGPIMTTKRKVLGGDIKSKKSPKVNIKSVKKGVKTRKVRIVSKDADDTVE